MQFIKIICFLVAGICFILGLKLLGKTKSARKGNAVSAIGMLVAIIGAFVALQPAGGGELSVQNYLYIGIGLLVGGWPVPSPPAWSR